MKTLRALLCLCLALAAWPAAAETYRMDLIVFLNLESDGEQGQGYEVPSFSGALEPAETAALRAQGIEILPDDQFGLADQWARLRSSRQFRPLLRLAWLQSNPPTRRGPALRLRYGAERAVDPALPPVPEVQGSVAMLLDHYLQLDADLSYADPSGQGFRLEERRRMRRDELHHLDSPRLGIVARVSKAAGY